VADGDRQPRCRARQRVAGAARGAQLRAACGRSRGWAAEGCGCALPVTPGRRVMAAAWLRG